MRGKSKYFKIIRSKSEFASRIFIFLQHVFLICRVVLRK